MARIDRPTTDQPTLPLENIEQTEIRITNENLDDALRILRQVLEEAKTNDDNSPESFLVDYDLPSDSRRHGFYRRARAAQKNLENKEKETDSQSHPLPAIRDQTKGD